MRIGPGRRIDRFQARQRGYITQRLELRIGKRQVRVFLDSKQVVSTAAVDRVITVSPAKAVSQKNVSFPPPPSINHRHRSPKNLMLYPAPSRDRRSINPVRIGPGREIDRFQARQRGYITQRLELRVGKRQVRVFLDSKQVVSTAAVDRVITVSPAKAASPKNVSSPVPPSIVSSPSPPKNLVGITTLDVTWAWSFLISQNNIHTRNSRCADCDLIGTDDREPVAGFGVIAAPVSWIP